MNPPNYKSATVSGMVKMGIKLRRGAKQTQGEEEEIEKKTSNHKVEQEEEWRNGVIADKDVR